LLTIIEFFGLFFVVPNKMSPTSFIINTNIMANEQKSAVQDTTQNKNQESSSTKGNKKLRYLLLAIVIFIAVFIYDVSPVDLMPLLPFDDIAVSGGGLITIVSLLAKYYKKNKKSS
jgi:hypothetical protein